jgi:hypothetical protein
MLFFRKNEEPSRWNGVGIWLGLIVFGMVLGIALPHQLLLGKYINSQRGVLYPNTASYPSQGERMECLPIICPNGVKLKTCECADAVCLPVAYFGDPCPKLSDINIYNTDNIFNLEKNTASSGPILNQADKNIKKK